MAQMKTPFAMSETEPRLTSDEMDHAIQSALRRVQRSSRSRAPLGEGVRDGRAPGRVRRETWMRHVITALLKCGVEVHEEAVQGGPVAIAALDVAAIMRSLGEDVDGLYAELLRCVKIRPDPAKPAALRDTIDDDFEELKTLVRLRMEAFQVMTGFRLPPVPWARFSGLPLTETEGTHLSADTPCTPAWADLAVHRA